jgi:hypothetical protein
VTPRAKRLTPAPPTAHAILAAGAVVTHFQPIYSAKQKSVIGVEALSRGRSIHGLAQRYKRHMIAKINERKLKHRRYAVILNPLLCELGKADVRDFDAILTRLIANHPQVECLYVLDESGNQVTESICNFDARASAHRLMFRPAAKGTDHSLKEFYYVLLDVDLQKYTTEPYVSLASGNLCQMISTCFRDANNNKLYILCIDVAWE